ncbi:MAG: hypothetical protein L0J41_07975 [Alkalibacterium sp.]|nr:hypothetical protein [Alkalibacterium sp.]
MNVKGGEEMLTDKQISDLVQLLEECKENNMSLGIAEVTRLIYPLSKKAKQEKTTEK